MARSTRALIDAMQDRASPRVERGRSAQRSGLDAEQIAADALIASGWRILGRRIRTEAGEVDLVARNADDGMVAFVEIKARARLAAAAEAIGSRQRARLLRAAEILLGRYPDWARGAVRFDVIVIDAAGSVRRIADAFRLES